MAKGPAAAFGLAACSHARACTRTLAGSAVFIKEILEEYTAFTGLEANFHKSSLVPINLNEEETNSLANMIGCSTASMPFTYLGLPMGTTKPTIRELSPLIDRVEKRLTHSASFF
jgi:hypothetical protein